VSLKKLQCSRGEVISESIGECISSCVVRAWKFMRPLYTLKPGSVRRAKGTATIAIVWSSNGFALINNIIPIVGSFNGAWLEGAALHFAAGSWLASTLGRSQPVRQRDRGTRIRDKSSAAPAACLNAGTRTEEQSFPVESAGGGRRRIVDRRECISIPATSY